MRASPIWSPAALMACAVLLCAAALAAVAAAALGQPWLGVRLAPDGEGVAIVRVLPGGPADAAGVVPGALTAVAPADDPAARIVLHADDMIEEPDSFESFARVDGFRARQSQMRAMLAGPVVLETEAGPVTVAPAHRRPPASLPLVFWAQILVGAGGLLIGAWVWSLRRDGWGPRMFALAGLSMLVFAFPASIYSTRELALDGDLLHVLAIINHAGAATFGAAMIGLFLSYPRRIIAPVWLWLIPVLLIPWLVAHELRLTGSPPAGALLTMVEMLGIVVAALAQWRLNRKGDPRDRAALRWLGLSVVLGAGAFIAISATPAAFGVTAVVSQGWSFLFFLLIYVGIALGLRRYRLFELDQWAFRILFYTGGLIALILFDAALIYVLSLGRAAALGVALLLVGFLYLPLRDVVWRRMTRRRGLAEDELFRAVVDVAFAGSASARAESWRALLARLFDPLEIAAAPEPVAEPALREDGLTLVMPPVAGAPSLALRHPWGGRGLFATAHLKLAQQLVALMRHADESRDAYERGAAGERTRIAKDLHDDVGARLLSGLHKPDIAQTRETLRESIADIRTIVSGLSGERLPLDQVLGDLRYEAAQRFEAAGITLDWPAPRAHPDAPLLDYRIYRNLRSVLREIVSNIIRHSGARAARVAADWDGAALRLRVQDDGAGFAAKAPGARKGNGLTNMQSRIAELGGVCDFPPVDTGAAVDLSVPLAPGT